MICAPGDGQGISAAAGGPQSADQGRRRRNELRVECLRDDLDVRRVAFCLCRMQRVLLLLNPPVRQPPLLLNVFRFQLHCGRGHGGRRGDSSAAVEPHHRRVTTRFVLWKRNMCV